MVVVEGVRMLVLVWIVIVVIVLIIFIWFSLVVLGGGNMECTIWALARLTPRIDSELTSHGIKSKGVYCACKLPVEGYK